MTRIHFSNGLVLTPDGGAQSLTVVDGLITALDAPSAGDVINLDGGYLLPGFIDTQVNGGGGVLFNDETTVAGITAIGEAHARYGTTGFLPTLISDELHVVDVAMRAVEAAIEQGVPGVLGIHIEGPFLSVARKGIHNPAMFRTLDADAKVLLKSLKRGKTMVTLAPETCTPEDIAELAQAGIIISAGHTNATYQQTRAALDAGVTGFTHLFNAMSPLHHRAPGVVGAALENQTSFCGLILDGFHVHPAAVRVALRCKSADRFMLVTDAMPTVGSSAQTFKLGEKNIRVEDGALLGEDGTLAGSHLDMAGALRYAVGTVGATLKDAAIMAATAPAAFLGLSEITGSLAVGQRADLVWLDKYLQVRGVWCDGKASFSPPQRLRHTA
jgi:N-acetylglucosamine-6-phosphate deacetylase